MNIFLITQTIGTPVTNIFAVTQSVVPSTKSVFLAVQGVDRGTVIGTFFIIGLIA